MKPKKSTDDIRVLLVNDDGVHAPGLEVLQRVAEGLFKDIWIIAPEQEQSGASRGLTLDAPVRLRQLGEKRFAVAGTPTDCVLLALLDLMKESPPDLLLSGINFGQNMAEDITFSGTVAAALIGMELGIPSIALSQTVGLHQQRRMRWQTAEHHAPILIRRLLESSWPSDVVLNVNFPDCEPDDITGVEVTAQGFRDQRMAKLEPRMDPRGGRYYWLAYGGRRSNPPEGVDLRAVYENRISVTPIHINITHFEARDTLRNIFQNIADDC